MVQTLINVDIDTKKVEFMLSGYRRTIPKGMDDAAKELASFSAFAYLTSAKAAGITSWRGTFFSNFQKQVGRPRKIAKNTYGVSIAATKRGGINYAIALDRMKPHWISLRKGRIISKWAKDKLGRSGMSAGGVFVRPHPYINSANRMIGKRIKPIVHKHLRRKIKRRGRG